jgi:DNA-binding NtrC family response regulator
MSRFDLEAPGEAVGSGVAAAPVGPSVLVVGRISSRSEAVRRAMRHGFAVAEFVERPEDADRLLPRCHFDCIVVEAVGADDPVISWIESQRGADTTRCICACGAADPALERACTGAGAVALLPHPLDVKALQRLIAERPGTTGAAPAPRGGNRIVGPGSIRARLVGESDAIRRVRSMIERVAPTPATVLIEGETGTGKELVARMIHERCGRRGPFVAVNCGAIPPELMETELFGHSKGAFTGAHQHREGLFVAARGGTLFLDEVSEMRSDLQVKLLRALEEGAIRPVGTDRELAIDVRIVASSQPGLRDRVRSRTFREDLYYRINVVHIVLPELRRRRDDIPALVEHFMRRVADDYGMAPVPLDEHELSRLAARDWPGNVRELRNVVERMVLMGALPDDAAPETTAASEEPGAYPVDWTLEQVKQAHIERVLAHNDGNRSATARQLGVSRKTLERRLGRAPEGDPG